MMLQTIPQNYIYNIVRQDTLDGDQSKKCQNDFYLRALKITNDTGYPIKLLSYTFSLMSGGRALRSRSYESSEVDKKSEQLYVFVQRQLTKLDSPLDVFRQFSLVSQMGDNTFWDGHPITTSSFIQPNEASGLLAEHFQFTGVGNEIIDNLKIQVTYEIDGQSQTREIDLEIKQYQTKGDYIFPLAGAWQVYSNYNDFNNHRDSFSQEFALDLIKLNFANFDQIMGQQINEISPSYNEPVLAAAAGEIVDIVNAIPENPMSLQMLSKDQMIEIGVTHGVAALTAGNHVIVDHKNGEYSLYAHLISRSISVKKGDKIRQGETIGRLGNSGNSEGPHLHFQLMDAPSLETGRGLPCSFTNLIDVFEHTVSQITEPKIIVFGKQIESVENKPRQTNESLSN